MFRSRRHRQTNIQMDIANIKLFFTTGADEMLFERGLLAFIPFLCRDSSIGWIYDSKICCNILNVIFCKITYHSVYFVVANQIWKVHLCSHFLLAIWVKCCCDFHSYNHFCQNYTKANQSYSLYTFRQCSHLSKYFSIFFTF